MMTAQVATDRWQEIRGIHREYRFFYQIGGGLLLVTIGILVGGAFFSEDPGYKTNLYTEVLSIGVTVFILNLLAERREERRRIRDLQERLVMEAGSTSNETAKRAIHELRHRGWLEGENGLLRGQNLVEAKLQEMNLIKVNLKGANLHFADLQSARLWAANMQRANLTDAKMQKAELLSANLQNAILSFADLQEASCLDANLQAAILRNTNLQESNLRFAKLQNAALRNANLREADLRVTNLQGTDFSGANLRMTSLEVAQFDDSTILPDGIHWTPDTDLFRFTDPNHINFWRSDDPDSPAYRGKSEASGGG